MKTRKLRGFACGTFRRSRRRGLGAGGPCGGCGRAMSYGGGSSRHTSLVIDGSARDDTSMEPSKPEVSFKGRRADRLNKTLGRKSLLGEGPLRFEDILTAHVGVHALKRFCIDDMSQENLLFYLEVVEFRQMPEGTQKAYYARKIYRKFVHADAPMAISVSYRYRQRMIAMQTDGPDGPQLDNFDELFDQVAYVLRCAPQSTDKDRTMSDDELRGLIGGNVDGMFTARGGAIDFNQFKELMVRAAPPPRPTHAGAPKRNGP